EQCEADPHDLDTRSDVYALGVVLYELLCDKPPYNIGGVAVNEAARVIREQQPTRLSTVNATLRGDTETIVLKALEKDRERRYQSATELARDIRRYLAGEAIAARPPSIVYQLRVLARRNKAAFAAVATVFVVLVAASIVSTSLYLQAEAARVEAEKARVAEEEQRKLAETNELLAREREAEAIAARQTEAEQRQAAETAAVRAEQVAELLREMLEGVNPAVSQGRDTTLLREILDRTASRLDTELQGQPEVEAELRRIIGWAYYELRLAEEAVQMLRAALALQRSAFAPESTEVAEILNQLGCVLAWTNQGAPGEAESMLREALEIRRREFGAEHLDVARAMMHLGTVLHGSGRLNEAEFLMRDALVMMDELCAGDPELCRNVNVEARLHLGRVLHKKGHLAEAEPLFREALAKHRELLPSDKWVRIYMIESTAACLRDGGKLDEAEALYREALASHLEVVGPGHPMTSNRVDGLVSVLMDKGAHAEAEAVWREYLEDWRNKLEEDDPATIAAAYRLGTFYLQTARHDLAEPLLREACEKRKRVLGEENSDTLNCLETWLLMLNAQGKTSEARRRGAELIAGWRRRTESPDAKASDYEDYAWLLLTIEPSDLRDAEAALPAAERAVELSQRKNPSMLDTLAVAYEMSGDLDKAIETQRETLALLPKTWSATRAEFQERLVRFLEKKGERDAAEQVWRDSVDWLREHAPGNHGNLASAFIYLGITLNDHD
ncbi:MAG: tetratricopeptide repeat protein, partial [Phycisphaerales bacterium]